MENNDNIKYMTEEQRERARRDIEKMCTASLLQLFPRFKETGMKTCVELMEQELKKRGVL